MPRGHARSEAEKQKIAAHARRTTIAAAAREFRLPPSTVHAYLKQAGAAAATRKMTTPAAPKRKFRLRAKVVPSDAPAPPAPLAAFDAVIAKIEGRAQMLRTARELMFPGPTAEVQPWDEGARATMNAAVDRADERVAQLKEARALLAQEWIGK